jgi:hypothetical protein
MLSGCTPNREQRKTWIFSSGLTKKIAKHCFALAQYGAPLGGLSPADFMDGTVFQIGQPPARVDILHRIDGISFDEAWENRIEGLIDGEIRTSVISKNDLIRNKLASGKEQDILDVKKLRAAARENPSNDG